MNETLDGQQLRVHVILARTLNMAQAATELGLTASAISHCLKALEHDLGCALYERHRRGIALTEAGREFLPEAVRILEHMGSARRMVQQRAASAAGHLRVAASASACRSIVAPALREFRESFPSYTIQLQPLPSTTPTDLTVTADPDPDPGLDRLALGEDELQFFAHPLHPWVVGRKVDRANLALERLILPERGTPAHARIREYFDEEDIRLDAVLEVADEGAAQELIRLDVGVGILPRWVAADAVRLGELVGLPLGRRRLRRQWVVQFRRGRPLSLAETLLANLCRRVFHDLTPSPEG